MTLVTRMKFCVALAASLSLTMNPMAFADGPQTQFSSVAAPTQPATSNVNTTTIQPRAKVKVTDVALSENGTVVGRVLTGNGTPVDGAQVVIRQGDQIFAKMLTNNEGQFTSGNMRAGVYTVATVQGSGLYRLWPQNIAPPSAKAQALVMTREPVARAQFGGPGLADWATLGIGVAGLTVGIITLDKVNDIDDRTTTTATVTTVSP